MQLPKNPVLYFIQALTTPVHTLADQSYLNPVCSAPVHSTPIFNINWKILLDSTTPKDQSLSRPSALLPRGANESHHFPCFSHETTFAKYHLQGFH